MVLSGLLHAASRVTRAAAVQTPSDVLSALTQALSSEEMRASEHPAIRNQLLAVTTNIMRWLGPRWVLWTTHLLYPQAFTPFFYMDK